MLDFLITNIIFVNLFVGSVVGKAILNGYMVQYISDSTCHKKYGDIKFPVK